MAALVDRPERAGNGRYAVAVNGGTFIDVGTRFGNSVESYFGQGGSRINPFVEGGATETFNIAGLQGGADIYGIMDGVDSSDSFFQSVLSNAPTNAVAAIMRVDSGPTSDIYLEDTLLFVNLTSQTLQNPMLGMGNDYVTPLLVGGFTRDPVFGGAGPNVLNALSAGIVYATLAPTGDPNESIVVNASASGATLSNAVLNTNGVLYLVPGTLPGDFSGDGRIDAADYVVWRKNNGSLSDYSLWRGNFDRTPGSGSFAASAQSAVPEPSSLMMLIFAIVPWRLINERRNRQCYATIRLNLRRI